MGFYNTLKELKKYTIFASMNSKEIFSAALGIQRSWNVTSIKLASVLSTEQEFHILFVAESKIFSSFDIYQWLITSRDPDFSSRIFGKWFLIYSLLQICYTSKLAIKNKNTTFALGKSQKLD
jgi:hypothetical protein